MEHSGIDFGHLSTNLQPGGRLVGEGTIPGITYNRLLVFFELLVLGTAFINPIV